MPDGATVEVLWLLSNFEERFRSVTYSTLGRLASRVDPYTGGYGYRRVSPSRVRHYRQGTLERAVAPAALAVQEFEAALGVLGHEDIGIPVHHLCREGRLDEDEEPSAAARRLCWRVGSSMDDVPLRAFGARSFREVTVDWAERYERNTTEGRVADAALVLQAFESASPRVLEAGRAPSSSARAIRIRDEVDYSSALSVCFPRPNSPGPLVCWPSNNVIRDETIRPGVPRCVRPVRIVGRSVLVGGSEIEHGGRQGQSAAARAASSGKKEVHDDRDSERVPVEVRQGP